jgi:predicted nucleotidyltransferase
MRLTGSLKQIILRCATNRFDSVDVYLLGSRVDHDKTGGDSDFKMDIVLYHPENRLLAEESANTAVKLT